MMWWVVFSFVTGFASALWVVRFLGVRFTEDPEELNLRLRCPQDLRDPVTRG